jgi:hypothetical protein
VVQGLSVPEFMWMSDTVDEAVEYCRGGTTAGLYTSIHREPSCCH